MNLKLKRLVRTTNSEQYALFDLDQLDEEDELPLTIGKLDLHYTAEGVYGTMLLWDEASRDLSPRQRRAFIQVLLEDIVQPMGVPNEYVIEFFAPTLDLYEVYHNVDVEEDETDEDEIEDRGSEPGEEGEADIRPNRRSSQDVKPQNAGGRTTQGATRGVNAVMDDEDGYDPADYDEDYPDEAGVMDDEDAR